MSGAPIRPQIVVIGAGLSGAAFALHLLRDHNPAADIILIEPRAVLGAGLAYGTDDPEHRVNVAASRMSLFSERPDHFDHWLRERGIDKTDPEAATPDGRLYPQRALFARYVHETLRGAAAGCRASLRHLRRRAVFAAPSGGGFHVRLDDRTTLDADFLVLAVSHTEPELPAFLHAVRGNTHLIGDAYGERALDAIPSEEDVLVVGTGLTGCDVIASLHARRHEGRIVAVSRRGLLPRPRTTRPVAALGSFDAPPCRTALGLLRRVREAVAEAVLQDRPWEDVIEALRNQARTVWGSLPLDERRRVLRHLRPFWDAHRFQSAPQVARAVEHARRSGSLEILTATPLSADWKAGEWNAGRFRVRMHARGAPPDSVLIREVGWIVNCTGPGHRTVVECHPVLRALQAAGALGADPLRLGIAVDCRSRAIRPDGDACTTLFVVGPLARGTHGELMGLPQVSTQPREVAALVADSLPTRAATRRESA